MSERDDAGVTVMEVVVASAILVLALATFLGGLDRTSKTEAFTSARQESLDSLRIAATEFARDARAATSITAISTTSVRFIQYLGPGTADTLWEVYTDADGSKHLRRVRAPGTAQESVRLFLVDLTEETIFLGRPTEPDGSVLPQNIRRIELHMSTQPLAKYPDVDLTTEVSLRNVEDTDE